MNIKRQLEVHILQENTRRHVCQRPARTTRPEENMKRHAAYAQTSARTLRPAGEHETACMVDIFI